MNFLKSRTTWTNLELGIVKICLVSAGVALGSYFHQYLQPFVFYFLGIYLVLGLIVLTIWARKEKS
jgi:hypothetical protein